MRRRQKGIIVRVRSYAILCRDRCRRTKRSLASEYGISFTREFDPCSRYVVAEERPLNPLRAIHRIHRGRILARYLEAAAAASLTRSSSSSPAENCSRPRSPLSSMASTEPLEPLRNTNKQHLPAICLFGNHSPLLRKYASR